MSFLLRKAAWASPLVRRLGPVIPSQDAFYSPPEGYGMTAPGTILRERPEPFPIAAFGNSISLYASHQLLYRTTDSFGNATATVTTLLVLHDADNSKLRQGGGTQIVRHSCTRRRHLARHVIFRALPKKLVSVYIVALVFAG